MPRKPQFSKNDVISAAFELVKKSGWPGLSTSAVAGKLSCSTMPIYSHFKNLEKLQDEVVKMGWAQVKDYESRRFTGDVWIDQAMGYILFARDEPHLFKCIIDSRNQKLKYRMNRNQWDNHVAGNKDNQSFPVVAANSAGRCRGQQPVLLA